MLWSMVIDNNNWYVIRYQNTLIQDRWLLMVKWLCACIDCPDLPIYNVEQCNVKCIMTLRSPNLQCQTMSPRVGHSKAHQVGCSPKCCFRFLFIIYSVNFIWDVFWMRGISTRYYLAPNPYFQILTQLHFYWFKFN